MVNEWNEFLQYTGAVTYAASGKRDTSFLGRFTWDTLLDFEGLARILTILARGHLFHLSDGSLADDPRSRIEYTRRACALGAASLMYRAPLRKRIGSSEPISAACTMSSLSW